MDTLFKVTTKARLWDTICIVTLRYLSWLLFLCRKACYWLNFPVLFVAWFVCAFQFWCSNCKVHISWEQVKLSYHHWCNTAHTVLLNVETLSGLYLSLLLMNIYPGCRNKCVEVAIVAPAALLRTVQYLFLTPKLSSFLIMIPTPHWHHMKVYRSLYSSRHH